MSEDIIRIFVGTDEPQYFAVQVLEHSIKRHTSREVEVKALNNINATITLPKDERHGARTGFSFARFAIPELMDYKGKAIYLDADMLVFSDISELWEWDMTGYKILIADDKVGKKFSDYLPGKLRIRQSAVMVIDCEKCQWNVNEIVGCLGDKYSYEMLMYEMCILSNGEIGTNLPFRWNSLEYYDENTSLIHYTDMLTQPWVDPENPYGYLWVNELRMMIREKIIGMQDIKTGIDKGFIRPSLYEEIKLPLQSGHLTEKLIKEYMALDAKKSFIKHKSVIEAGIKRKEKIRDLEHNMNFSQLLKSLPCKESTHPLMKIKYYLYLLNH